MRGFWCQGILYMFVCVRKRHKRFIFNWNDFVIAKSIYHFRYSFKGISEKIIFFTFNWIISHKFILKVFCIYYNCLISSFVCKVCYVFIMGNYYLVPWHLRSSEKLKIVINDETRTSLLLEDRRKITTQNWKNEVKKERAYEWKQGRISKL